MPKEDEVTGILHTTFLMAAKLQLHDRKFYSYFEIRSLEERIRALKENLPLEGPLQRTERTYKDRHYEKNDGEMPIETIEGRLSLEGSRSKERTLYWGSHHIDLHVYENRKPDKYFRDFMSMLKVYLSTKPDEGSNEGRTKIKYTVRLREDTKTHEVYFSIKRKRETKHGDILVEKTREYDFVVSSLREAEQLLRSLGLRHAPEKDKIKHQVKYNFPIGEFVYSVEINEVMFERGRNLDYLGTFFEIEMRSLTSRRYPFRKELLKVVDALKLDRGNLLEIGYSTMIRQARGPNPKAMKKVRKFLKGQLPG